MISVLAAEKDTSSAYKMVHIYPTTLEYESRVESMTGALARRSDIAEIVVVGFPAENLSRSCKMNCKTTVLRVGPLAKSGNSLFGKLLSFSAWYVSAFRKARRFRPDFVNCHSVSALPLSYALAKVCKATLIYEPHELETETLTMQSWRRSLAKMLEARLIKSASLVIAVSASAARKYSSDYGIDRVHFIRNLPMRVELEQLAGQNEITFRSKFGMSRDDIIFLYQGVLAPGRGVEVILDAFKVADRKRHVVFMGFGVLEGQVRLAAKKHENIHFHPPAPSNQLLKYTVGADVGIAFLDRSCLNHEFALPNKLFQYLHAGKPVLCTSLIEMSKIVNEYEVGWLAEPDSDSLQAAINAISLSEIQTIRENIQVAVETLNWQDEEKRLNNIYDELLNSRFE